MGRAYRLFGTAAFVGVALASLSAQQRPRATFKSSVDLVPVDVSVVDKSGKPIADLTADDFALTIDGRPRKVISAQFFSAQPGVDAQSAPKHYSTNAGAEGGRLVVLVIDAANIGTARAKGALEAAGRFVGRLNRADRVALVTIPGGGPQIDFTSNHALVQSLLQKVVGQSMTSIGARSLGIAEALAIERGDDTVVAQIAEQQCTGDLTAAARESCLQQLTTESNVLLADTRARSSQSVAALRRLFDRLGTSETPKTVVFVSEGLLLNRDYSEVSWIGPRASAGHIALYVLQIDSPDGNAAERRGSAMRAEDREVLRGGLEAMAGMARGDVFRIVSNAEFVFQRLALELSGYYLLGFEPLPGERDARPHKIKVDVRRKDVEVRARREFSVSATATPTTEDAIVSMLRDPILASDVRLELTTYTFQDPETSKVKLILAAEIDRSLNLDGRMSLGYVLVDEQGRVAASQIERALTTPVVRETQTQNYVTAILAAPGMYTLKLAVIDQEGRRGSVERTFTAKINAMGPLRATDLLIADDKVVGFNGPTPAVAASFTGDEVRGYLELFSDTPDALRNASVTIEVAENESAKAIEKSPARFQNVEGDRRRAADGAVSIALLPPGSYVVRAMISVDGREVGQVFRPFQITRPARTATDASRPVTVAPKVSAPVPLATRIGAFDRSSVLSPQVVGFFLERLGAAAGDSPASVRPAVEDVRAGRFAEAMQTLGNGGDDQLAVVFLKGLVLLSRGELNPAANKFRDALRIDSEFFPAAFYLGACYAAGGRDREAAGAWQTSLVTESNAPFIYSLLGDALLRLRDVEQAIDILTEARAKWPSDDQIAPRLATALVMGSRSADALPILDSYLARHPDDTERLFLALRSLYEARAAGRSLGTAEEDRARFARYADAYAAAKGPQLPMVEQWRKQIEKK